ncbi:MAG: S46 family peptidase [Bacteroidales bacterium]|nr:S46 family peptidase [Bacteroidales bacterium]MBN2819046.1 S46 family peptidase [Bacteroidales bacterium]
MKRFNFLLFSLIVISITAVAKEGMWLPLMVDQMSYEDLKNRGFKLTADEIYSVNQASLTDAVVIFGGGCTGEVISRDGLILTNHHCGFGSIQRHSSVENNYIQNGFWAMNKNEELPNSQLSVKFLVSMQGFTGKVMADIEKDISYVEKMALIKAKIENLEKSIEDTSAYQASIEGFYENNEFYLFMYNEYMDIRLVGAPPESIGGFGGDTDNWVWPRHSADFSLFRIYTGPDGKPAEYAEENVPYIPKKYFSIDAGGIEEGDFTMVLGYPGSTSEYLYSEELKLIQEALYPDRIKLRDGRLEIINSARNTDEKTYIDYAVKQSRIANAWKKWKGVLYGFERFDVIEKRLAYEEWLIKNSGGLKNELSEIYDMYDDTYNAFKPFGVAVNYFFESAMAVEPFQTVQKLKNLLENQPEETTDEELISKLESLSTSTFEGYNQSIDKDLTKFLLQSYINDMDESLVPPSLKELAGSKDISGYINKLYEKSFITSPEGFSNLISLVKKGKKIKVSDDPFVVLFDEFVNVYRELLAQDYEYYGNELENLNQQYIKLIQKIDTTKQIYPDANFTMRITYGQVEGYSPSDAVEYHFQSYLDGVIQKGNSGNNDYIVPKKLVEIYEIGDFGKYADASGKVPVCFIASNHTSGGNSGSPVLDNSGKLIGINFDRTWEGTMSDFYFDEEICRNISVDIRYVLFIIDKFAGAGYLLDEMDITW